MTDIAGRSPIDTQLLPSFHGRQRSIAFDASHIEIQAATSICKLSYGKDSLSRTLEAT